MNGKLRLTSGDEKWLHAMNVGIGEGGPVHPDWRDFARSFEDQSYLLSDKRASGTEIQVLHGHLAHRDLEIERLHNDVFWLGNWVRVLASGLMALMAYELVARFC